MLDRKDEAREPREFWATGEPWILYVSKEEAEAASMLLSGTDARVFSVKEILQEQTPTLQDVADHFEKFIRFAATCRGENTYEWMCLMLDWLNGAVIRFDESAYFDLCVADHFVLRRCKPEESSQNSLDA